MTKEEKQTQYQRIKPKADANREKNVVKRRENFKRWYYEKNGKESTRQRKGYREPEAYAEYLEHKKEETREKKRQFSASDAGKRYSLNYSIRKKFGEMGFTIDDYDAMYDRQNGKCAICEDERPKYGQKRMHIDHCHASNFVRALLCPTCNSALGGFKDSVKNLKSAIAFLGQHGVTE